MFTFKELNLIAVSVQSAIWDRTQALFKRSYYYFCNSRPPFVHIVSFLEIQAKKNT